jgi:predicted nucleic acid-binding protein
MPDEAEPIVINTGPLIALASCGHAELLRCFHTRVVIPEAVMTELWRGDQALGHISRSLLCPEWMEISIPTQPTPPLLRAYLDEGEAAVITLALELGVQQVLIDERRGRLAARVMGLTVSGTVGVLLRAKKAGMLPAVKPWFDAGSRCLAE